MIGYEYGKTPVQSGAARLGAEGLQFSIPLPIITGWGNKSMIKVILSVYHIDTCKTIKLREQPKAQTTRSWKTPYQGNDFGTVITFGIKPGLIIRLNGQSAGKGIVRYQASETKW